MRQYKSAPQNNRREKITCGVVYQRDNARFPIKLSYLSKQLVQFQYLTIKLRLCNVHSRARLVDVWISIQRLYCTVNCVIEGFYTTFCIIQGSITVNQAVVCKAIRTIQVKGNTKCDASSTLYLPTLRSNCLVIE